VSPQHAWEATYADQGMGLGHTLSIHREKFGGVLNGIDYGCVFLRGALFLGVSVMRRG